MRWEPKPYRLNGWEFQFDEETIKAMPNVDVLQKKIADAATHLSHEIAKAENSLMLQCLTDETLKGLAELCKNELRARKERLASFKKQFGKDPLKGFGKE